VVEDAHINIGDPHQRKPGNDVATQPRIYKLETQEQQRERRDIVRKAILAREEIEKLSLWQRAAIFAFAFAELARLAEDFFVRDSPRHAGDRQRKEKKDSELMQERDVELGWHGPSS